MSNKQSKKEERDEYLYGYEYVITKKEINKIKHQGIYQNNFNEKLENTLIDILYTLEYLNKQIGDLRNSIQRLENIIES